MYFTALIFVLLLKLISSENSTCRCRNQVELVDYGDLAACGKHYIDNCYRWFRSIQEVEATPGYKVCSEWEEIIARYCCCRGGWTKSQCKCASSDHYSKGLIIEKYTTGICGVSNSGRCYYWFRTTIAMENTEGYNICNAFDRIIADQACCAVGPQ